MPAYVYIFDKGLSDLVLNRTVPIHLNLSVETRFPIFLRSRRGNRMDCAQNATRFKPVCVLPVIGKRRNNRFGFCAVNPSAQRVDALIAVAYFNRTSHGYAEIGHLPHHFKFMFFAVVLRGG